MSLKRVLSTAFVVSSLALPQVSRAQQEEDVEKVFGDFRAVCAIDSGTRVRECNVRLRPEASFFTRHGIAPFLVFIDPVEPSIGTMGSIPRLRVDRNPPLVGDCSEQLSSSGLCQFEDKAENQRFLNELTTGKALSIEVGRQKFDFRLDDYRKALAAFEKMVKPAAAAPAAPPG